MFSRTLLAVSLSAMMMGTAFAQSLVEQPLNVQTPTQPLAPLKIEIKVKPSNPSVDTATDVQTVTEKPVKTETTEKKRSFFKKKEKTAEVAPAPKVTTTTLEPIVAPEIGKKIANVAPEVANKVAQEPVEAIQPLEDIAIGEPIEDDVLEPVEPKVTDKTTTDKGSKTAPATSLSLQTLNNAQWSSDFADDVAKMAFVAKAQVILDNAHTTPGAIDGQAGNKMSKAIRAFQIIHKLNKTGEMNQETWNKLVRMQGTTPTFIEYTITPADVNKNLYVSSIPDSYEEKSKMSGLKYTRTTEMLGEKFHLDEAFLRKLNPNAKFVAGEKIIVPNVHGKLPEDISVIIAMKEMKQVYLFNSKNQMVGSFPATVGKETSPSPSGTLKVTRIAKNPWYTKPGEKTSLPAGPNTPVGNVWIALSKPSYGIHGTPEPSKISNDGQGSAGCVRLTNWDANRLAAAVKPGVTVIFRDDSIKR